MRDTFRDFVNFMVIPRSWKFDFLHGLPEGVHGATDIEFDTKNRLDPWEILVWNRQIFHVVHSIRHLTLNNNAIHKKNNKKCVHSSLSFPHLSPPSCPSGSCSDLGETTEGRMAKKALNSNTGTLQSTAAECAYTTPSSILNSLTLCEKIT